MFNNIKYSHNPRAKDRSFLFDHVHIYWNEQITMHQQNTWELSYVISGKGMRVIGDNIEPFDAGEIILIPPNIPHYWSFEESTCDKDGKIENITLVFRTEFLEGLKNVFSELDDLITSILSYQNAISLGGDTLLKVKNILIQMKDCGEIDRISLLIKMLAYISSPEIANTVGCPVTEDKKNKRLHKIYLYIMDHYQYPISLKEIASHVNMEKTAFCIFFKKMTGKTFVNFMLDYRINVACELLAKTDKNIAEICLASGFRDVPYFNRVFKRLKNTTPGKFREQVA